MLNLPEWHLHPTIGVLPQPGPWTMAGSKVLIGGSNQFTLLYLFMKSNQRG